MPINSRKLLLLSVLLLGLMVVTTGCLDFLSDDDDITPEETFYQLTVNIEGQGEVEPEGGEFEEDTIVTLAVDPADDYEFDGWSGTDAGQVSHKEGNEYQITMDGDKELTAVFKDTKDPDDEDEDEELTVEDAKDLVASINDSGTQLRETMDQELETIEDNLTNQVSPYMKELGGRMARIELLLSTWQADILGGWEDMKADFGAPGEYTLTSNDEGLEVDEKADIDDEFDEKDDWEWTLNYEDQTVIISASRLDEITYSEDDYHVIDLSQAEFDYSHSSEVDDQLDYGFNFKIESSDQHQLILEDEREKIILPGEGRIDLEGKITDSSTIIIDGEERDFGAVTLDLWMEGSQNSLEIGGSFDSPYLNTGGNYKIQGLEYELDEDRMEIFMDSMELSGDIELIDVARLDGELDISFDSSHQFEDNDQDIAISLPTTITLDGKYEAWDESVYLGSMDEAAFLELNLDYSQFDLSEEESEDNFLDADLDLSGKFEKDGFHPFTVEVELEREGMKELNSDYTLVFINEDYIKGTMQTSEEEFVFQAEDNRGLDIDLAIDYEEHDEMQKVGQIKDPATGRQLAEIYFEGYLLDGSLYVDFADGISTTLLY